MYFIPRNNKLYHYIAHTNVKNRYLCTGFFIFGVFFTFAYCLQCLINVYSNVYTQELLTLQKQYKDSMRIEAKNKQLIIVVNDTTQDIKKSISSDNAHEYFKKQLLFVLDTIKNNGLKLNSYGVQQEKSYGWYKKEIAHFDIAGSFKQIMDFFELLQKSQKMISVGQWTLVRLDNDTFHVHCDLEFILILSL